MAQPVSIVLTGDVMLGRGVNTYLLRSGPAYPWGNTVSTLSTADLAIINLECVIARSGRPWSRWPKVFQIGLPACCPPPVQFEWGLLSRRE